MRKQIPNLITSLNLLCGCIALLFAASGALVTAAIFVYLGIFFDFFDGLAARSLGAQSKVGLELDSLADVVTSGVAPAVVMVQLLSEAFTGAYLDMAGMFGEGAWNHSWLRWMPFIGLLIAVASAYRLAKFNVDTRQTDSFIGLPTPANALLILSIPLLLEFQASASLEAFLLQPWFLIVLTVLSCFLLNAEIKLFALKFKRWDFQSNKVRYFFLIGSVAALVFLQFLAIPIIIVSYIVISLLLPKQ
ncbi:CDP-alcohol phosphatidyltransferase family protein [Altibacter sp. HG106]|uniref:CDP-alcohol phosphatidyltransferase family protein n=1 Tax=Altibacter sp. HG106 TaxID=3023937 RepID=UPI002350A51F|nr:CDP-alcohol phosphatidyltransferase family protein [Altibacter sp. HG106]MDC7995686.1 CDP-alcohol phosphatidyltransferase family protein [Altibacter sp. HG106]